VSAQKGPYLHACHLATSNSVKQHKLRKLIAWLSGKEGREKDFISLYIPHETLMEEVVASLKKEAESIVMNSERAEDRLQKTLKNVIQQLKQQTELPENGLVVFAGTFANNQGEETFNFEVILPPEPVANYLYMVDNHFELEPLREMLRDQKIVGIITLDAKEASFGLLIGERLDLFGTITSGIPGKTRKGGQSQRRYERERDMELTYYFHRIAEHAAKFFLENRKVTVLIVGGPGPTKDDFVKGNFLHYELDNALLDTVDTQSAGGSGIREVVDKSSETLKNICAPEERRTVQRLMTELAKQDGLATYGFEVVLDALKKGAAEVAIVSDSTGIVETVAVCKKCGLPKTMIVDKKNVEALREIISRPCERCGAVDYETEEKDIVDVLEDAATQTDARVEVISTKSEEKAKLMALGGVAAILRYRPK
jgi:peptide chain release factor subunit 1